MKPGPLPTPGPSHTLCRGVSQHRGPLAPVTPVVPVVPSPGLPSGIFVIDQRGNEDTENKHFVQHFHVETI